ncbi:hypothetical protein BCR41DRAFT_71049 [Lobosporangium transversale]|uniref:P-loop containing nucleoside triphosphate hydrolase protein n=1 Tax=Lobosporangium transversale TaxID=64571 RepID=A0A1Y2H195_9FUNG|nr:hypothetical protein BCR41DRAFT_71049 [Lobosporangium transversale]ORZ28295.1 hypothetical protein BCR41DRAFT_71049 [Lobosporangium transversale]|eukprot:XP_021885980.1 hypothetical protein BCR41DRAFT_71049 [Lobosporangium transversale]
MFSDSLECQMTWKEMNLNPVVMASIARAGLEKPSNIQKMIMEPFQQGKDLIAQSQSQNDRTNTLAIALLQKLSSAALTQKHCQALVVCSDGVKPQKVHEDFQIWFKETPGLEAILLTTDMAKDTDKTSVLIDPEQPKQVVVTTLGPLLEAVRNNVLDMKAIGTVVISMRVAELVDFDSFKQFLGLLARDAQVILMTGRIEPKIQVIKDRHFRADAVVRRADELTMQWSEHYYVSIPSSSSPSSSSAVVGANEKEKEKEKGGEKEEEKEKEASDDKNQKVESTAPRDHKWEVLMQILTKNPNISHTVILTQSQSTTEALTAKLAAHKLPVLSAWSLADNTEVARQFNGPDPCILVSELTLMDNLDLDYSSLMINYEMSRRAAYYISSFGPFGRSGLRTLVINLCDPGQKQTLEDIESLYDIKIQEMQV